MNRNLARLESRKTAKKLVKLAGKSVRYRQSPQIHDRLLKMAAYVAHGDSLSRAARKAGLSAETAAVLSYLLKQGVMTKRAEDEEKDLAKLIADALVNFYGKAKDTALSTYGKVKDKTLDLLFPGDYPWYTSPAMYALAGTGLGLGLEELMYGAGRANADPYRVGQRLLYGLSGGALGYGGGLTSQVILNLLQNAKGEKA